MAQENFAEVVNELYQPKNHVKGYVSGESFLTNAKYHERSKWLLNIDIEDFFGSITFPRVRGLFLSEYFGFNQVVATCLARICTFQNSLPQGAKTSPVLSNIIAYHIDRRLIMLAKSNKVRFTRYADDITFSSTIFPVSTAFVKSWEPVSGARSVELSRQLLDVFRQANFEIKASKTRLQLKDERQVVTGLVVNKRANIRRSQISNLRMKIHSINKFGVEDSAKLWLGPDAKAQDMEDFVGGWLSYIRQVRGANDQVLAKLAKQALVKLHSLPKWVKDQADMILQHDVFLSHASEDKDIVRPLKDKLEALGVVVFFDESSISWGDSIVEKVNQGLLMSKFFVPYLSENFAKKGWTNKELNSAISLNISRKGRILPITSASFNVEKNYPLLGETLYRKWPSSSADVSKFIDETCDAIIKKVEEIKSKI